MTTQIIKQATAKYFNMPAKFLDIKTRKEDIRLPRQIAHYICLLKVVTPSGVIGKEIGKLDHATVLNSRKSIRNMIETKHRIGGKLISEIVEEIKKEAERLEDTELKKIADTRCWQTYEDILSTCEMWVNCF